MIDKIIDNSGHINSLAGILVVFAGLIAISLAIGIFNRVAGLFKNKPKSSPKIPAEVKEKKAKKKRIKEIPEDELVAIAVAVEAYRKIHFDNLQNEITFTHGTAQTAWKMLERNRKPVTRTR